MSFEIGLPTWRLALQGCLVLLAGGVAKFLVNLYNIRHKFQLMQNEGLVSVYSHVPRVI